MEDKTIKTAAAVLGATLGGLTLSGLYAFNLLYDSIMCPNPRMKFPIKSGENNKAMPVERKRLDETEAKGYEWFKSRATFFFMTNARGEELCGYYVPPKEGCNVLVFLSHGFGSNAFRDPMLFVQHYHEAYGFGLFVPDHTACGGSAGKYVGFSGFEADDCLMWLEYIEEKLGDFKIILHGVSMGGATVMRMTGDPDLPNNVVFCIDDCGFSGARQQMEHEFEIIGLPKTPSIKIFDMLSSIKARYKLDDCDVLSQVKRSHTPTLFIHGGKDDFVPTKMVYELYDACPADKDLLVVEDATHAVSVLYDPEAYWDKVESFISKYL